MVRDDNCETDVKSQREHYVEKQLINCNNKKRDKSERLLGSSLRHCSSRFHSGFCIASVSHKKYSSKFDVTLLGNNPFVHHTTVQNSYETRYKYWATHSLAQLCSLFSRTLLANSFVQSSAHIHSLAQSLTPSLVGK